MRILALLLIIASLWSCDAVSRPPKKAVTAAVIHVSHHRTIETFMILRALCDTDYFMKRIADTSKARPMIYRARQFFAAYKQHPAVAETQALYAQIGDIGGVICQGLLYAEELPGTRIIYEPGGYYWKEHKKELQQYMRTLAAFYKEAKVERFFAENNLFYEGAAAEAKSFINDSAVAVMEAYFGKRNGSYRMYILPLSPMGSGFSCTTRDSAGTHQYAIISPVEDVDWDGVSSYKTYGFGGPEAKAHYRELVVHEFVHSFITDKIETGSLRSAIDAYDSLYTPGLDSMLGDEGYSGWWAYVNELFVRSAHIRVMEQIEKPEAEALRKTQKEIPYILIPETEAVLKEYEDNRSRYGNIDAFLPNLIRQFKAYNKDSINRKLAQ